MKKIIQTLTAGLLLLSCALQSHAGNFKFQSFITGYEPAVNQTMNTAGRSAGILFPWATTNTITTSNVTYYTQAAAFGYTYGTNVTLVTNVLINPALWALTTTNVFYIQNTSLLVNTNSGNAILTPAATRDVDVFDNRNGDPASTSLLIALCGDNAAATNTITFVFGHSANGIDYGTGSADKISITMTANGTNQVIVSTNVVASFVQGQAKLRLLSYSALASAGSTNIYLNALGFSGFIP